MPDSNHNCQLVAGKPMGPYEIALIMKITYKITNSGQCITADEQLPLIENPGTYDDLTPPETSPPNWDSDLFAFKPGTDVVVQGHAYSYVPSRRSVEAQIQIADTIRTIRVHGDRQIDWHHNQPRFTEAQPFERMPIRYDRAYGGYDPSMDTTPGELVTEILAKEDPDEGWATGSRQYYPRNPAGCGYVAKLSRDTVSGMQVPNLEFPSDVITPARLAIGEANNWLSAPLPAAFDWVDPSWFPRIAYLGLTPEHTMPKEGVREITNGWATPNLMEHKSVLQLQLHPTFQHGASPCLIQKQLQPGTRLRVVNMFPDNPDQHIQLTSKSPKVRINITDTHQLDAVSGLGSIVIQPDENRLIEVWSARVQVTRPYGPNELENMTWTVQWN